MWSYYEGWAKQVIQETRYKFRQGELESLFEQGYTINDAIDWAEEAQPPLTRPPESDIIHT